MAIVWILLGLVGGYILAGLKVITEYERGVKFTLGKFSGLMKPGLRFVAPIFQKYQKVDVRVKTVDVPEQDCITKDNVSVNVNAVLYYKIRNAAKAVLEVEDFMYAISQLAQTTMRDVVGEVDLDNLLSGREMISKRIREIVDKASDPWGIEVVSVELKHIELPQDMKRTIAKQAEAEREKRAVITKAKGELIASKNLAGAAKVLSASPGALHLRTLATLNDLSSDQSNTVVFVLPLEVLKAWGVVEEKKT
ncbi:slipin family protein [Candidatus Woesearchaeota archaeon]|nr:slipin family protein [Candidatus Woesearchaeota archaeon]RLE42776.1 MAG: slipin family protein [Candidatus Woesearchaeota archaeon]